MNDLHLRKILLCRPAEKLFLALWLSVAVGTLACGRSGAAGQAQAAQGTPATVTQAVTPLNLADCISLGLQRQPRLAAQRASLAAAEDGCRALEALRLASLVDAELPIRRRQAALGLTAAAAAVEQAERETIYTVTRTFFTVLYAQEQERVARAAIDRLSAVNDSAKRMLDAGAPAVTVHDVTRTTVYLHLAEVKRIEAGQGLKRALVALKEAIGMGCDSAIEIQGRLGEPQVRPARGDVLALALARRSEIVRASIFADVTCLEVEAQGTCACFKRMETFASGADIHSSQVPEASYGKEYQPGAVPPEMPDVLVGSRAERMKHALDLHCRACAVVEVTRNLIALEAEDAFLRWETAVLQLAQTREAAETGDKMADEVGKDFTAGLKVKVDEVINARVLAAEARGQYNEFLYKEIIALADLERITAGAFASGLTDLALPKLQPTKSTEASK
jgi:outer membrane protein TolC